MSPYVIVDTTYNENLDPCANAGVDVMSYLDGVLPVFTSQKLLWEFVRNWHSEEDPIRAVPLEVDAIQIGTMAQEFEATVGLKMLVFNPEISPSGYWIMQEDPISVSSYCRYILELACGTKRSFAEGREKLRDEFPDSEELNKAVAVWVALQADKVNADARARMEEWEIKDSSCYGEEDIQT